MNSWFAGLLLCGAMVAGCGQKSEKPGTASTNAASSGGNLITAPVDYIGAVGKAQQHSLKVVDTVQVQQAIQYFQIAEGRYPQDLDELVKEGHLVAVPKLPTGMQYQYNTTNGQVKVVTAQ